MLSKAKQILKLLQLKVVSGSPAIQEYEQNLVHLKTQYAFYFEDVVVAMETQSFLTKKGGERRRVIVHKKSNIKEGSE